MKSLSGAASLMVLALVAVPAHAREAEQQGAASDGAVNTGDIVVTARRVQERLQDVPVAITAVQGERLEQLGVTQVADIRQVVSGLNISSAAGRVATPTYTLRGQRQGDAISTQDPPVAVYIDEVLLSPMAGSNLGLFDLENVQVLKGPQGTLFGKNTTGGAVLYTTAKPTDAFEGSLRIGYGNFDTRTATGVLNLPVNEAVRLRAAADYTKSDGYGRVILGPYTGKKLYSRDEINLRFTAAVDPAPWLKTITTVYYSDSKAGDAAYTIAVDTPRPSTAPFSAPADYVFNQLSGGLLDAAVARRRAGGIYDAEASADTGFRAKVFGVNSTISVELSDTLTLKNIFGYRRLRYAESQDYDGTILPILDSNNVTNFSSYTEELQLQGTAFDDRLNFIFGTYYSMLDGMDGTGMPGHRTGTVTFGGAPTVQYGNVRNSSLSGFGQIGFKLTDTLTMDAGLRYTVDRRAVNNVVSGTSTPGAATADLVTCNFTDAAGQPLPLDQCRLSNRKSFAEPSWLVDLNWKPDADTLVYIATRHSYRSGGFNLRGNNNGLILDEFYRPEKVTDLELGFKRDWLLGGDWRFRSNIAAYYQWYKDIQRNVSTIKNGVIGNVTQNAAKAHIYGLEAELELRSGRLFSLGFNYSYTKPQYDSYPTFAPVNGVPNQPDDYSKHTFQYVPKHQINANLTLSPDIGDFAQLTLTANAYYQSRITMSDDYENRETLARRILPSDAAVLPDDIFYAQKGYTLVNLRAELGKIAGTGLSVAGWVRNVFDKRYIDSSVLFQDSIGMSSLVYGAPRTYGIDVKFAF